MNFYRSLAILFSFLGFFLVTWDRVGTFELGGFTVKACYFCFVLAYPFYLLSETPRKNFFLEWYSYLRRDFPLVLLALALFYAVGIHWSELPIKSAAYLVWLLFGLLVVLPLMGILVRRVGMRCFSQMVLWTLFFNAVIILIDQVAFRYGYSSGLVGHNQAQELGWKLARPSAFTYEPSYIANFLSLGLLFLAPQQLQQNLWQRGAFLVACVALLATTSRTGWFSFGIGVFFIFAFACFRAKKVIWRWVRIGCGALLVVVLSYILLSPKGNSRHVYTKLIVSMVNGRDGSGYARLNAFKTAWIITKNSYGRGVGLGASYYYWVHFNEPSTLWMGVADDGQSELGKEVIMSTWGQVLAEGGVPGVIFYCLGAVLLVSALWRRYKSDPKPELLGALAAAFCFFIFSAHWLGNIARTDMWVWYGLWSFLAHPVVEDTLVASQSAA